MSQPVLILVAAAIILMGIAVLRDHAGDVLVDVALGALILAVLLTRVL